MTHGRFIFCDGGHRGGACRRGCKRVFACDDDTRHHCAHRFDSLCLAALICHAISTGSPDTPDALIDPGIDLAHLEMPPSAAKKVDSERAAAMAMGAAVLAARVAALGEGLGHIERGNPPLLHAARNGL